ncbi:MAG: D-alanyl-D-alanine carboxypeptidase/D-alanyl-D-alanine-endopeptidase [Chitinophagales bacterium]|nr:D-alanyl-D-alanine carboxypeptidase/D-alanyl-D-alanine-endopeptidase [Bacteroidota bacterium]MCB9042625.1 D-alanyl-D-alanine carboxypeptidase/D-alanyl-D-alanine-endopeptidase [Chitinophagales bacterium]
MFYSEHKILFISFISLLPFYLAAQSSQFYNAIEKFENDKCLKAASWSLTILNVDANNTVFEHNSDMVLAPASTLKTVTTSSALAILGANFRFETMLQYDGFIDDEGVLHGNMYIKGGGDPTLGFLRNGWGNSYDKVLRTWLGFVRAAGIKKITGAVIGDASIFETSTVSPYWLWEDIGNYYGAGACGLTFHENQYNLGLKPGKKTGAPTLVAGTDPALPGITFVNEVITGNENTGDEAYLFCAPYSELIYIRGRIPRCDSTFYIMGTIPDPALFTAYTLHQYLKKNGIDIQLEPSTLGHLLKYPNDAQRSSIGSILSPPLHEIVYWANQKSINLYCEHLLKMIGYKVYKYGSAEAGLRAIHSIWKRKGINLDSFFMMDGSGLSPVNAVSTKHLAEILRSTSYEAYFPYFDFSLSHAGDARDHGSLRNHFVGTKAQRNLRAKSGYIERVRSYSGFVQNNCGELLSFSFIVNNYTCDKSLLREKMFAVMKTFAYLDAN